MKQHLVTCNAGVIDADYRDSVEVLLFNHHPHEFYIVDRIGDRIGQIVFTKKFDVIFEKVSDPALLERTKRGSGGFGSKGSKDKTFVSTINDQVIVESVSMSINDKVIIDSDVRHIDKIVIGSDLSESNDDDSEEIDKFFCSLKKNKKVISLLILFCISERFSIVLISFLCGYCFRYYFYNIIKRRKKKLFNCF